MPDSRKFSQKVHINSGRTPQIQWRTGALANSLGGERQVEVVEDEQAAQSRVIDKEYDNHRCCEG